MHLEKFSSLAILLSQVHYQKLKHLTMMLSILVIRLLCIDIIWLWYLDNFVYNDYHRNYDILKLVAQYIENYNVDY